jgi:hypothetical protein
MIPKRNLKKVISMAGKVELSVTNLAKTVAEAKQSSASKSSIIPRYISIKKGEVRIILKKKGSNLSVHRLWNGIETMSSPGIAGYYSFYAKVQSFKWSMLAYSFNRIIRTGWIIATLSANKGRQCILITTYQ